MWGKAEKSSLKPSQLEAAHRNVTTKSELNESNSVIGVEDFKSDKLALIIVRSIKINSIIKADLEP